ncbi:hypothetical protein CG709_18025 [Lachnotalea glycerini]|nr:hypothetical protein CG709_18025 [Lachnotalea glycerini]
MFYKIKKHLGIICCLLFAIATVFYFTSIKSVLYQTSNIESSQASFQLFTDELFKSEVTSNTLILHYTLENPEKYNIDNYPITFGNISEDSFHEADLKIKENLKALETFDYEMLSSGQQLTYDILHDYYQHSLEQSDLIYYSEALSPTTGTQAQLPILMAEYTFNNEQDILNYLTLLAQMDDYYTSIINFEKEKSKQGLFMASDAAHEVISQCSDFINDPENNFLISTFNTRVDSLDGISDTIKNNYKLQNKST